jgi:hypothetical protein
LLDTEQLAVVIKPSVTKTDAERPLVRIITDPQGNPIEDGPEVDLATKDDSGAYPYSIVRLVDNAEYNVDTSRYFV